MRDNPGMRVELRAFTDCVGGEDYNRKLSLRRAEAARGFLVQQGIKRDRILAFGYGELNPVVDCDCDGTGGSVPCTEDMHAQNRRTEVAIIEK
jgi:outer membrane protein OmpA-like peptidoglycan-associated protein